MCGPAAVSAAAGDLENILEFARVAPGRVFVVSGGPGGGLYWCVV